MIYQFITRQIRWCIIASLHVNVNLATSRWVPSSRILRICQAMNVVLHQLLQAMLHWENNSWSKVSCLFSSWFNLVLFFLLLAILTLPGESIDLLDPIFFCGATILVIDWFNDVNATPMLWFRMARDGLIRLYFLDGLRKEAAWLRWITRTGWYLNTMSKNAIRAFNDLGLSCGHY